MKKLLKANKKLFENLQINIFGLLSTQNQKIYAYETGMGKRESDNILNLLSIPLQNTEGLGHYSIANILQITHLTM